MSDKKNQIEPFDAKNATSPLLNLVFNFSPPVLRLVSMKAIVLPIMWALPSNGIPRKMEPIVFGARWRFSSNLASAFPFTDKTSSILETDPAFIFDRQYMKYITFVSQKGVMSDEPEEASVDTEEVQTEEEPTPEAILPPETEAVEVTVEEEEKPTKRGKKELSAEDIAEQERLQKIIAAREIIEVDPVHEPVEYQTEGKGKIMIGPPTLTRFEKARILGARALQLSLGAPPFISVPKEVATSLDLAYNELEKRVIPITIRRVLPNGDFQNIPIDLFD